MVFWQVSSFPSGHAGDCLFFNPPSILLSLSCSPLWLKSWLLILYHYKQSMLYSQKRYVQPHPTHQLLEPGAKSRQPGLSLRLRTWTIQEIRSPALSAHPCYCRNRILGTHVPGLQTFPVPREEDGSTQTASHSKPQNRGERQWSLKEMASHTYQ